MASATYDGSNIFGQSVSVRMEINPSAAQLNEFFGVTGMQSLFGGGRGRVFLVSGVLLGGDDGTLASLRDLILTYDDGVGRVLVDTLGDAWPSVVFRRFQPGDRVLGGWVLPYKAQFDGLI
jgi:hypothetical protein